ncbi:MAG: hypothetical protein KUL81_09405, partial [Azonexus sp.]|nr:hypothetical protein [Azonexus sp.]
MRKQHYAVCFWHAGYRIELTVLSTNAELSLTALLGQPAGLDLQTSASHSVHRQFHGHITEIAREGANGGFARYRLIIEPWLAFQGHTQDSSWDYRSLSTRPQGAAS